MTPVAQSNAPVSAQVNPGVIRSAMSHRVTHPHNERIAHRRLAHAVFIDSANTTHKRVGLCRVLSRSKTYKCSRAIPPTELVVRSYSAYSDAIPGQLPNPTNAVGGSF